MHLLDRLSERAAQYPRSLCLQDAKFCLNTQETLQSILHHAQQLQDAGAEVGDRIAILLPRGVEAAIAIYAVLYCGCSYIPLDPSQPEARTHTILEDAKPRLTLHQAHKPFSSADSQCMAFELANDLSHDIHYGQQDMKITEIAAILYTSGSTGKPKGVVHSHKAIAAFADWAGQTFALNHNDRIANTAPFNFDLSTFDLFASLRFNASTVFMPPSLSFFPSKLSQWLHDHCITTWYTVPSMLQYWSYKGALDQITLPDLRQILFAGEPFPAKALKTLTQQLSNTQCYNLYGPTETNVCCYWPVDLNDDISNIPIGQACCGDHLRIDPQTQTLHVKGPTVSLGYWHDHKIKPIVDTDGWYDTHDRVSLDEHQRYHFHGRNDRLLKCNGYRIEPGEIEQAALTHPNVQNCFATAILQQGQNRPVLAYQANASISAQQLLATLKTILPQYMLPSRLQALDSWPLLANGKTDIQALQRILETS